VLTAAACRTGPRRRLRRGRAAGRRGRRRPHDIITLPDAAGTPKPTAEKKDKDGADKRPGPARQTPTLIVSVETAFSALLP